MDYKLLFEAIKLWRKKAGLVLINLVVLPALYASRQYFENYVYVGIPIVLIFLIITGIWLIDNQHIILPNSKSLRIGLLINLDDEDISNKLLKIVKPAVRELNLSKKHPSIHVNLLPINKLYSEEQLNNYLDNNEHSLDTLIYLKVQSGKENNQEKFIISQISFTGRFNGIRQLYRDIIEFNKDISIRNQTKNWEHLESNTFNDKPKLKENLKDHILFYSGIYLLLTSREEEALGFFKILYNKGDNNIIPTKNEDGKLVVQITPKNLAAARLANILINLLIQIGAREAHSANLENKRKALKYFTEAEDIMIGHSLLPDIYIALAKLWYDLGNLNKSKDYTKKLEQTKAYASLANLNRGFYAMIENNEKEFIFHYKKILKKEALPANPVVILEHIQNEKVRYPNSKYLFDLAEAIITKICFRQVDGNKLLSEYVKEYNSDTFNKELIQICYSASKLKSKSSRKKVA